MKTRIITAAVLLCILAPILIFSHTFVYVVFAAVLALVATYELLGCMHLVGKVKLTLASMIYSVLTVSLTRVSEEANGFMKIFACMTFVYIFILLTFSLFESEKQREKLPEIMKEDIPKLAVHAAREGNPLYPVPRLMNAEELEKIYRKISNVE